MMRFLMLRAWARCLEWLQRRCAHPGEYVTADVLEGGYLPLQLNWCRLCGSHRFERWPHDDAGRAAARTDPSWTKPHPEWWTRRALVVGVLLLAVPAFAEFTASEKTQVKNLGVGVANGLRGATRAFEGVAGARLTDETRGPFYAIEHALSEAQEAATHALFYILGAVAERGNAASDFLKTAPRSEYLSRAYAELDVALEEAAEAREALEAGDLLLPGDTGYHAAIANARAGLDSAVAKLSGFNRALPYLDPVPAGLDPVFYRDSLATQGFQSANQYGYDAPEGLFEVVLNSSDPVLSPAEAAHAFQSLSLFWLVEDDVTNASLRAANIPLTSGEDPRWAAVFKLIGGAAAGTTTTRFHFALSHASALITASWARPALNGELHRILDDGDDSWRHMDNLAGGLAR